MPSTVGNSGSSCCFSSNWGLSVATLPTTGTDSFNLEAFKKVSYDAALNIINNWLSKCGKSRQLDQNFDNSVSYALKHSAKNGHKPLKFDTLKQKNTDLYDLLNYS